MFGHIIRATVAKLFDFEEYSFHPRFIDNLIKLEVVGQLDIELAKTTDLFELALQAVDFGLVTRNYAFEVIK